MSLISVIVPVYKVEPYLHRCVDSILGQTFQDFELILVDDGSPDNCGAICDEYAAKDSRVHVIHQQNGGLSAARNAGIDWAFANSDSQWLTFIDSDDWIHPEMLRCLLEDAEAFSLPISICGYCEPTETMMPSFSAEEQTASSFTPEDLWCHKHVNATVAWAKLYRKDLFSSIRYPVGKIHEDEFVTYKILFSQDKVVFRESAFYCYFQNPSGIIRSTWSKAHLAALDAFQAQIRYFRHHGYSDALRYNLNNYVAWCKGNMQRIKALPASRETSKNYRAVRRKLCSFLLRNKGSFPYKQYRSAYEMAFPVFFRVYHRVGRIIKRY